VRVETSRWSDSIIAAVTNASVDAIANDAIAIDDGTAYDATRDDAITRNDAVATDDGTSSNDATTRNDAITRNDAVAIDDAATYVSSANARLPLTTTNGTRLPGTRLSTITVSAAGLASGSSSTTSRIIPGQSSVISRKCNFLLSKVPHAIDC